MPTFTHGRNTKVLYGVTDLSSYLKQANPSVTIDTPETTSFGSTVKTYVTGIGDGKISCAGMFDGGTGAIDEVLQAAFGQAAPVPMIVAPQGLAAVGERCFMLNTLQSNYSLTAQVSDMVGISADFQGSGFVKTGPVLHRLSTDQDITSSTITGTSVQDILPSVTATTHGGFGVLMVQTNSTNQTVTCSIEHAPDSTGSPGTWTQLLAFTAVTAASTSAEIVSLPAGTSVNPWLRVKFSQTTGTGTFNAHVSFARNAF